ncbi:FMN-binding negative transcriptional regulator [Alicyclobacillus shizuokensis]|uniref:FMN-binding negative transcriptional regulator n=1 Tax=Alicyclobacillus shizuokensis TaxID=392014 RepID=UPI000834A2E2|nr:FMN-binding negative transcriptional regulator [Alicyclobacillus shizuokensis]MCL6625342.1 FMN-binding negative transcriptional regulator [Alicyclobacillus shizuokensis]
MYVPSYFRLSDPDEITSFIQAHSFGILVSAVDGQLTATHLPFVYEPEQQVLLAHMARANPQWRNLSGQSVLVIFPGPHAYISPSWYQVPESVPTWNYVAMHVRGTCTVIDSEEERADLLEKMVRFYEPDSDLPSQADKPFYRSLMTGVVGFRIHITRVEGAAKLSQNKSEEVQQRVIAKLRQSSDTGAQSIAKLMQQRLNTLRGAGPVGTL